MKTRAAPLFDGGSESPATLVGDYHDARRVTERICELLEIEDYVPQAMPDVSPPRWHLGHVTWFFETCLLKRYLFPSTSW